MRDFVYMRPWEGKVARCAACGSTAVLTYRDCPHIDNTDANRLIPVNGDHPLLVGYIVFWLPCHSCRHRLEWGMHV